MGYNNRWRHALSDSLLDTKFLLALSLIFIIVAMFIPELANPVTEYISSNLPDWILLFIQQYIGPASIVIIAITFSVGYYLILSGFLQIFWAIDTSRLENKLNGNVSAITTLLGHSSYLQLKAEGSALNDFHKYLNSVKGKNPRCACLRRSILGGHHNEDTPRGAIHKKLEMSLWELIILTNYVRILETSIRQSTQAPSHILEHPFSISVKDIPIAGGIEAIFSEEEIEIIEYRIKLAKKYSLPRKGYYFITKRIRPVVLLEKGVSTEDYAKGSLKELVRTLEKLAGPTGRIPPVVNKESISNVIRLIDKQYDFKVGPRDTQIVADNIWSIQWISDKSKNSIRTDSIGISKTTREETPLVSPIEKRILELPNIQGFRFSLVKERNSSPALSPMTLDIEGYQVGTDKGILDHMRITDNIPTTEVLDRTQRLLLEDLFKNVVDGNALEIEDPSNIRMMLEGFADMQLTIHKAIEAMALSKPKMLPLALLRLNAYEQTARNPYLSTGSDCLFKNIRLDSVSSSGTLSTLGLLGLDCLDRRTRDSVAKFIDAKANDEEDMEIENHKPRIALNTSRIIDIPALELRKINRDLSETRRTEDLARIDALVWAATGAGAWIIKRNHMHYFTRTVNSNHTRGLLLVHHPLRERVFLETLTHRNYHYVWEILTNYVKYQEVIHAERNSDTQANVEFVWVRESFLPSGNSFFLNEESKTVLRKVTDAHIDSDQNLLADYCVMLTRSNQMIRGPVNGLNMIFIEESGSLSPLPAIVSDLVLRQRVFEELSRRLSNESGIVTEKGEPTSFAYTINWLRPLRRDEGWNSSVTYDGHSFSDPYTWSNLGFLDTLVKETKCAYALVKILSSYKSMLENNVRLPFKLMQDFPGASTTQDIDHITSSYDLLCDFLTGEGDFSKDGVHAVGIDDGYLDWLEKTLLKLPDIGSALGIQEPFDRCLTDCMKWMTKLSKYLDRSDDPLRARIEELLRKLKAE